MTSTPTTTGNIASITDPAQFTNATWAAAVLVLIGAPVTQNNLDNFLSWMTAENGASTWTGTAGKNNPLNNGLGSGGGDGTGSYPDLATAAVYAAKGVEGGIFSSHCGGSTPGGIAAALKANAPFPIFHEATIKSGWAGGCYSGSGWESAASAFNVPKISVAQAATNKSTHGPSIGNLTDAILNSTSVAQNLGASVNQLTGGLAGDASNAAKSAFSYTAELGKILGEIDTLKFWQRVGMGVLGVGLIVFGSVLFFSSTKTGQKAISEGESAGKEAATAAAVA